MEISIRDERRPFSGLANQSGQGVTEYILVLFVTVAIILGAVYQLNTAFKAFANNYFGNYLACLMETGELPVMDSEQGSGICGELFEPFSIAKGAPLKPEYGGIGDGSQGGSKARDTANKRGGGAAVAAAGESGRSGSGQFRANRSGPGSGSSSRRGLGKATRSSTDTGNITAGNYGGGYSALNKKLDTGVKYRLDNSFISDSGEGDTRAARKVAAAPKPNDGSGRSPRIRLKDKLNALQAKPPIEESEMSFSDFFRFIIIAALIIALVMFLGGQAMSISKSME